MRWTDGVVREVLPNGLTVLVQRVPGSPVVAVVTHVRAGYFDEPDEWVGIAHVLEHMYFKGTARRGVGEVAHETKRAGGYLNAGTIYDRTQYYTVLPAESLAQAIDIQSDALQASTIDAGELARELEVIVQEAKRKLDTPAAVTVESLYSLLFERHRMRRWRIGTEEELRALTRDHVVAFYRTRYVPRRTIVAIVGGVDPAEALELARPAYGAMPDREPVVDPSPEEPDRAGLRTRWLRGDVRHAVTAMGWRTYGTLDPRTAALDLAATVVAEGRGSWGFRELRAPGIVTSLGATNYTPTEVGVFQLGAECAGSRVIEAVRGMWSVTRALRERGPSEVELERAKALAVTGWAKRLEAADGRATALTEFEALGGYELGEQYLRQLRGVSTDQMREAARGLSLDRAAVVGYLPAAAPSMPEAAELEEMLAAVDAAPATGTVPRMAPAAVASIPGAVRRTVAGVALVSVDGVDILALRKADVPLATIGAVIVGPRQAEKPDTAGVSLLVTRAALRGAGHLDREGLAIAAERLGGSLVTLLSPDWMGWRVTVRGNAVAEAAHLLALVTLEPRLHPDDLTTERDLLEQDASRAADDMLRYPIQLALRAGFGDDAYGQPGAGTVASARELSSAVAQRWYHDTVRRGRLVIGVVGDAEPERTAEVVAGAFRGWATDGTDGAAPPAWRAGQELSEHRDKRQTALTLAHPAPPRGAVERRALEVLVGVAGGMGGRLFDAVRERRSLAYSVMAIPWLRQRAGVLLAYAATSPERAGEARSVMLEELRRFAESPVSEEELRESVQHAVGMLRVRRQSGTAILTDLLEAHVAGEGVAELQTDEAALRAVTREDVMAAAAAAFGVAPAVGTVIGASG